MVYFSLLQYTFCIFLLLQSISTLIFKYFHVLSCTLVYFHVLSFIFIYFLIFSAIFCYFLPRAKFYYFLYPWGVLQSEILWAIVRESAQYKYQAGREQTEMNRWRRRGVRSMGNKEYVRGCCKLLWLRKSIYVKWKVPTRLAIIFAR